MTALARHHLSRSLEGTAVALDLPLCWDAEQVHRHGPDYDTDLWFLSWDLGAIDPTALIFGVRPEYVDCRDCLEWMHA